MNVLEISIACLLITLLFLVIAPNLVAVHRWFFGGGKLLDQRLQKDITVKIAAQDKYRGRLSRN